MAVNMISPTFGDQIGSRRLNHLVDEIPHLLFDPSKILANVAKNKQFHFQGFPPKNIYTHIYIYIYEFPGGI